MDFDDLDQSERRGDGEGGPAADIATAGEELGEATTGGSHCGQAQGKEEPVPMEEEAVLEEAQPAVSAEKDPGEPPPESSRSHEALERVNSSLNEVPAIRALAESLQVPPVLVAGCGSFCVVAFLLYGFGGQFVCTLLGIAYPAFESFKVVEEFSNMADPSDMYKHAAGLQFWLIYWIVVAVFTSFEYVFYYMLIWMPFYYPLKVFFLLWLGSPSTRGANTVYHWLVSPILRRNRDSIDNAIEESSRKFKRSLTGVVTGTIGAGAGGVGQLRRSLSAVAAPGVVSGVAQQLFESAAVRRAQKGVEAD
mmetsp:Transcript_114457/g.244148  ORF Transcript_114457/g.244148 Transcript_114457/m.244148 type:complete len:307 (-) Transcript_114457:69-989(-)